MIPILATKFGLGIRVCMHHLAQSVQNGKSAVISQPNGCRKHQHYSLSIISLLEWYLIGMPRRYFDFLEVIRLEILLFKFIQYPVSLHSQMLQALFCDPLHFLSNKL